MSDYVVAFHDAARHGYDLASSHHRRKIAPSKNRTSFAAFRRKNHVGMSDEVREDVGQGKEIAWRAGSTAQTTHQT